MDKIIASEERETEEFSYFFNAVLFHNSTRAQGLKPMIRLVTRQDDYDDEAMISWTRSLELFEEQYMRIRKCKNDDTDLVIQVSYNKKN